MARELGVSLWAVRSWASLVGMELQRGVRGGLAPSWAAPADGLPDEVPGNARRLSRRDRWRIEDGLAKRLTMRAISALIGFAPSTVSREIRNHARPDGRYDAEWAHASAARARRRPKPRKLDAVGALRRFVIGLLDRHYSPQQIDGRLAMLFEDDPLWRVSHETIYQALYLQGTGALRHELKVVKALRSGRSGRKPASKLPPKSGRPWLAGAMITERPAEVADRAVPGHWEGDLIMGRANASALITLVERTTRFTLIRRVLDKESATITEQVAQMITDLPATLRKTLTWDQGTEMAQHARLRLATGIEVYFCDPHSPWQRPTNENHNGLIREFFPKGTDFRDTTDAEITHAEHLLNIRARNVLGFYTPGERLNELLNVALTA